MGNVSSELEMDPQHGPIIRVTVDGTRVAVYLAQETGVVTPQTGRDQYGIEVKGPWWKYRQVTALPDEVVDLGVLLECRRENERLRKLLKQALHHVEDAGDDTLAAIIDTQIGSDTGE